jgi:hypothetical protein
VDAVSIKTFFTPLFLSAVPLLTPIISPANDAPFIYAYDTGAFLLSAWFCFWWKAKGDSWGDGTALYYVVNLREIQQQNRTRNTAVPECVQRCIKSFNTRGLHLAGHPAPPQLLDLARVHIDSRSADEEK